MDRLDMMRVFCRVVDRGTFAQAAKDLQIARPTVSNTIKALEQMVGVRLLHRTTRQVQPTAEGRRYYERCRTLLEDFEDAIRDVGLPVTEGPITMSVQGNMARHFVLPRLREFLKLHPGVELRLLETDRIVDLIAEGIDCVLRAGPMEESSLVCRKLGHFEEITCASPDYLQAFGTPKTLEELDGHRMVGYLADKNGKPQPLDFYVDGQRRDIVLPHDIGVTGAELYTACALNGYGIIQAPRYHMERYIGTGELTRILDAHPPAGMPLHLVYPARNGLPLRARMLIDWLASVF
ncbi:LysR family transcriptional regulator [Limimaricola soesokkakensis]|uniref:LysR family transcriptional regulator n=1 Tax=Limimaricola soesokkakensis TaxID=1343159 RepID=UPI003518EE98